MRSARAGRVASPPALLLAWVALAACDLPLPECRGIPAWPGAPRLQDLPGLHTFNDQQWSALTGNGWSYARRRSSKEDDVCVENSADRASAHALRIVFTPDMAPNSEPSVHWIILPLVRRVYAAWWVKLSPNWTPSPAGGGKITFLHTPTGQVYTGFFGSRAPHHVSVNTEWAPYAQRIWDPNVATTPVEYGQWYRIEWYMQWETAPGARDGIMQWWVNGVLNG
ncbi:MAG TPA: hypothetical protein VM736_06505, partial [Gemmatimonadales bacterium]|nr:hypothetical protein [Gemmatimonadales bacterium]